MQFRSGQQDSNRHTRGRGPEPMAWEARIHPRWSVSAVAVLMAWNHQQCEVVKHPDMHPMQLVVWVSHIQTFSTVPTDSPSRACTICRQTRASIGKGRLWVRRHQWGLLQPCRTTIHTFTTPQHAILGMQGRALEGDQLEGPVIRNQEVLSR